MESGGMTSLSKQFDVKKLDDIIALIALYRPGPMELIPEYVKAKKGITPIKYCIRCSRTSAPTPTA
jgi:DNA polymerase III, alpha subunit